MDKLLRYCALALLALLISGCDKPGLEPLPANGVILAFGDSLTAGVGAEEDQSYPEMLARLSGLEVINAGVSGEVTAAGQARLSQMLDTHTPDLLILLEGGNDILRNHDLNRTKTNLAAMIESAHAHGVEVVLIGVPEKNLFSEVASIYPELAQEYELVFIPDLISELLRDPQYKSDRIHFNAAGYRAMAQEIHAVLRKHGALE
jgi:lysophospholipase L1-like esterase